MLQMLWKTLGLHSWGQKVYGSCLCEKQIGISKYLVVIVMIGCSVISKKTNLLLLSGEESLSAQGAFRLKPAK
jgi:hypothetical protein